MKRLYESVRWRNARKRYLNEHPLCRICEGSDRLTAATVVDHIQEHKGDYDLFWDESNWQPLCASCHSGIKRIQDHNGFSQAAGIDGQPIDPGHPWNIRHG